MKPTLILLFFLQVFFAFAQNDTTYFLSEWKPTLESNEAKFYTLDTINQNGFTTLFDVKTKQKYVTYSYKKDKNNDYLTQDGEVTYFYTNGNVQKKGVCKDGLKVDVWQEFYESGAPKENIKYDIKLLGYNEKHLFNYQVLEYWDNLGAKSVENGNGLYFFRDSLTVFTVEIKNGLSNGNCSGTYRNNKFTEQYNKGELQGGEILVDGATIAYDKIKENPSYIGGIREMYMFIGKNLKYPVSAQKAKRQGKVFVKFAVEKDNSLSSFSILKGIGQDCDDETLRVIKLMNGNWQAGKVRGVKERIFFTMPVSFVLE